MIDLTNPSVTCATPPHFLLNQAGAFVSANVSDTQSGYAVSPVTALADTSTIGGHSANVTGYDNAGRSTTMACGYYVGYVITAFSAPIDNPSVVNSAKAGQAIPVKWRLTDANGVGVSDPASFVSVTSSPSGTCGGTLTDVIETYSGSSGLQYLGDGNWQFNWKTPKTYMGQCRTMFLNLADQVPPGPSTRYALFTFK